jgi:cytochrome P450
MVHYDPFDHSHHDNPYPLYRRLRDEAPAYYNEKYGFWLLSRYEDCRNAAADFRTFTSALGTSLEELKAQEPSLINSDPPVHTRLRNLVTKAFQPQQVNPLEQAVRDMARELLAPHLATGKIDIIADFAARLPMAIICQMLGFPRADENMLRGWTDAVVHRDEGAFEMPDSGMQATLKLFDYFERDMQKRTGLPARGDLVTSLMEAEEEGKLTHKEVLGYIYILSIAGNETTTKLIGNMVYQLHKHPDQRKLLLDDMSLVPGAVEETLRYDGPTQMMARTTTTDVSLHGKVIPANSKVGLLFISANRDERKFDNAEVYDVTRDAKDHLGFGFGLHACLGMHLARLEGKVALEEILRAMPDFSVDEAGLDRMHSPNVRGFTRVPVRFGLRA